MTQGKEGEEKTLAMMKKKMKQGKLWKYLTGKETKIRETQEVKKKKNNDERKE